MNEKKTTNTPIFLEGAPRVKMAQITERGWLLLTEDNNISVPGELWLSPEGAAALRDFLTAQLAPAPEQDI